MFDGKSDRPSPSVLQMLQGASWGAVLLRHLAECEREPRQGWTDLLIHCQSATAGKPSRRWLKTAESFVDRIGRDQFRSLVIESFSLYGQARAVELTPWPVMVSDDTPEILRGLVWCCRFYDDPGIARSLTDLALSAYKRLPGIGPRSIKIGNGCLYVLGEMSTLDSVAQLAILKARIKLKSAQNGIAKALRMAADRIGITEEELEEIAVPAYGLTSVGFRREALGEFAAEIQVADRKAVLRWNRPDGKVQKSVPKAVKTNYPEQLKELKQSVKDIEKMLAAQAMRIEQMYGRRQAWQFPQWQERYLNHPLIGILARRLIWQFERGSNRIAAIWSEQGLVDHRNRSVSWPDDSTTVRLWHPLDEQDPGRITAWREWLHDHELRQPFKQAYREVYLLTEAERRTRTYSNRFAAHILKQHQFHALCTARGWKDSLRLMVDDMTPAPHRILPDWNLRAEFWVERIGDEVNDAGTFLYLTTDQVRFYPIHSEPNWSHAFGGGYTSYGNGRRDNRENQPIPLEEISPLVFSEVMRDVDLFVGVASVANDPTWHDGGPQGRYLDYWQHFSFGELSATAQTRKDVLQRLVPRLKIADRCSFSDRFLVVRGDLRTYRIHLGSGNILMEPNDQYLCIVPDQSMSRKNETPWYLPFEGDNMMSVILSKALMLAKDTDIKDSTIVSQIRA